MRKKIEKAIRKFKEKTGIDKVILFGSQASGEPDRHSDVDLLLVDERFEGVKSFKRAVGLHKHWESNMPVDFICLTPEEFKEFRNKPTIVRKAVDTGTTVKA